jgi:hypothetical protein
MDDGVPRSVASTDGYRNAVVPQVVEMIGHAILQTLSATTSSPSLIGAGANAPLGDTAPVPAFYTEAGE